MQIFIINVIEKWELFCDDYLKVHLHVCVVV
jgi:hypothetical protein